VYTDSDDEDIQSDERSIETLHYEDFIQVIRASLNTFIHDFSFVFLELKFLHLL